MDGFQKRTRKKQRDILEAALQLFLLHGIKKVSIAEIAQEANVSQVTIYNYFDSKDKLIHQAIKHYIDQSYQHYQEILNSEEDFPEKIKNIIFNKRGVADTVHEEIYQYLMNDLNNEQSYLDRVYREKSIPFFQQLISEGKKKGYINADISEEAIMFYIQMLKDQMQKKEINEYILPITEDILNLFFYGIMGKSK